MKSKHIAVIGAGVGGLTCALLLASRGYSVTVYEKRDRVGGRNSQFTLGSYTFDTGPTFLTMNTILREIFSAAGKNLEDFCEIVPLDPLYRLSFPDCALRVPADNTALRSEIGRLYPGNEKGFDRYLSYEKKRFERLYSTVQRDFSSLWAYISPDMITGIRYLSPGKSLYDVLKRYFTSEQLRIAFTFQAKYLGMSAREAPALFTMLSYMEHAFGVDHVRGGLSMLSEGIAEAAGREGAKIYCSTPVKRIITQRKRAIGIELADGQKVHCDAVVVNADFGHAATTLFEPGLLRKYAPRRIAGKKFSCSTFMLYLGLDKQYNEPHHNLIFPGDYWKHVDEVMHQGVASDDMSIYIRNASAIDTSMAPPGHSSLYILVPVPNLLKEPSWDKEKTGFYRRTVLNKIKERTSMQDLENHIVNERIITPADWERDYSIYGGATFNLAHTFDQLLYFRPHNRFDEISGCYLVGGGTHPGSGLPTIFESSRISAGLICRDI
ncbi:MAG: phytoene desaturase [Chitinivibrionales bacterium]|nr:phytoene desaturase [Chitinivibrionales bacterium]